MEQKQVKQIQVKNPAYSNIQNISDLDPVEILTFLAGTRKEIKQQILDENQQDAIIKFLTAFYQNWHQVLDEKIREYKDFEQQKRFYPHFVGWLGLDSTQYSTKPFGSFEKIMERAITEAKEKINQGGKIETKLSQGMQSHLKATFYQQTSINHNPYTLASFDQLVPSVYQNYQTCFQTYCQTHSQKIKAFGLDMDNTLIDYSDISENPKVTIKYPKKLIPLLYYAQKQKIPLFLLTARSKGLDADSTATQWTAKDFLIMLEKLGIKIAEENVRLDDKMAEFRESELSRLKLKALGNNLYPIHIRDKNAHILHISVEENIPLEQIGLMDDEEGNVRCARQFGCFPIHATPIKQVQDARKQGKNADGYLDELAELLGTTVKEAQELYAKDVLSQSPVYKIVAAATYDGKKPTNLIAGLAKYTKKIDPNKHKQQTGVFLLSTLAKLERPLSNDPTCANQWAVQDEILFILETIISPNSRSFLYTRFEKASAYQWI